MSPVEMKLSRIVINEIGESQAVYLKEVDGERVLPIAIGFFEATSITRRVREVTSPRPLTHDLVVGVVEDLGGELQDVVITHLKDSTYFADLRVRLGSDLVQIDSRPSDAIAVAVSCDPPLPIYVEQEVLDKALDEL